TPQELQKSVNEFQQVLKEAESYAKQIDQANKDLNKDIGITNASVKNIEQWIKDDIKEREARLKIPSLDVKELSKDLLMKYVTSYIQPYKKYIVMAREYIPEKKEGSTTEPQEFVPRARGEGKNFRFG